MVKIDVYGWNGVHETWRDISACGYSPLAMFFGLILLQLMGVVLLSLGWRKLETGLTYLVRRFPGDPPDAVACRDIPAISPINAFSRFGPPHQNPQLPPSYGDDPGQRDVAVHEGL